MTLGEMALGEMTISPHYARLILFFALHFLLFASRISTILGLRGIKSN